MTEYHMQELFLPVHGYVELQPQEVALVNTPAFQRLRRCRQLGFAHLLFPGATHTRFEHSIGTLHVAQRIVNAINRNAGRETSQEHSCRTKNCAIAPITQPTQQYIRLAALLHDIGHIPFGHTFEDELHHLDKHDGSNRLALIADRVAIGYEVNPNLHLSLKKPPTGWTLRELIDQSYIPVVKEFPGLLDLDPAPSPFEILNLVISKPPKDESRKDEWQRRFEAISEFIPLNVCRDIVGNTICADFIDYLFRDWYHLGKMLIEDPRLYHYMEVRSYPSMQAQTAKHKFVVNVGASTSPRHDAITNILDLLESRYKLAETVLFHRTKLSVIALLDRCLLEIRLLHEEVHGTSDWEESFQSLLLNELLSGSDDSLSEMLTRVAFGSADNGDHPVGRAISLEDERARHVLRSTSAKSVVDKDASDKQPGLLPRDTEDASFVHDTTYRDRQTVIETLIRRLENRDIYTRVFRFGRFDLTGADIESEQKRIIELYEEPAQRAAFLTNLESLCGLPSGSVAMYCSSDPKMNAKVAEVDLLIDDHIKSFKTYEEDAGDDGLTGGALESQIRRFQALWSAEIFMQRDVWNQLDGAARQDVQQVIRVTFLPSSVWGREITDLSHYRKSMRVSVNNIQRSLNISVARSGTEQEELRKFLGSTFPNGMPCSDPGDGYSNAG